jgi:exopolyphosphatase / guanosine-5'-triphosphate,3'-diphosphate pyrophosphatase
VKGLGALAAVDCGTNSTRLLIADWTGNARVRDMRITRLGQGVDRSHRLQPEAVERTLGVLREYRSTMDGEHVHRARLVATSAVRDASDGTRFLQAAGDIIGWDAELLSGDEEGRLSYAGATHGLSEGQVTNVVLDIGGGSTELVVKPRDVVRSLSMDIGCVRLTERFLQGDPPQPGEITAAVTAIDAELDRATRVVPELDELARDDRMIGLAGTVSTLAMLELGLERYDRDRIHHAHLTRAAVARWCRVLGAETVAQRSRRVGLPDGRQDVIFGGALILERVMERLRLEECLVSESDILDGLVLSLCPHETHAGPEAGQAPAAST